MKKYLFMLAAALTFTACNSDDEQAMAPTVTENDFESPDGKVVIQLGAVGTTASVITRAPIDGTDITKLTDLGIFALARGQQFTSDDTENWAKDTYTSHKALLVNVKAAGLDKAAFDPNLHQGPNKETLKKLSLYKPDASGTSGAVYYYPMQAGDLNYDFFGYQPREKGTVGINAQGKYTITFSNMAGDDDIITGRAIQAPTRNESELYVSESGTAGTGDHVINKGTDKALNGYNSRYIRKLKYNNWLIDTYPTVANAGTKYAFVPNIEFSHRLTRLNFQVITAGEQAGGTTTPSGGSDAYDNDREEAKKLRVSDITLLDIPNSVTLSIEDIPASTADLATAPELTWGTTKVEMPMQKLIQDNNAIWETATGEGTPTKIIPQEFKNTADATYESAGYLMVKPNETSYKVRLTVHAPESPAGVPQTQEVTMDLKLKNESPFLAGYSYNVRIALYALQQVQIDAMLTDWQIDPDNGNIYAPVE